MNKTLILSQRYSDDSRLIGGAAGRAGYEVFRMHGPVLPKALREREVMVYCEGFMAEYVSQQLDLAILRPEIDALAAVDPTSLRRRVQFLRRGDLGELTEPTFVKPADQKFFKAGVYERLEDIPGLEQCPADDPIFVSEIVEYRDEYRFFCAGGQVRTGSPYILDGEFVGDATDLAEPDGALIAFAEATLKDSAGRLPPGVVVDIGVHTDGSHSVIEFNPAWASGIYGCDPDRVLPCIEAACVMRHTLTDAESRFDLF